MACCLSVQYLSEYFSYMKLGSLGCMSFYSVTVAMNTRCFFSLSLG